VLAREVLALRGRVLPESHPAVVASLQTLGRSLGRLGDTVGAATFGDASMRTQANVQRIVTLHRSTGRPDRVAVCHLRIATK